MDRAADARSATLVGGRRRGYQLNVAAMRQLQAVRGWRQAGAGRKLARQQGAHAMDSITDPDTLRAHYGTVHPLALRKVLTRLDAHCRAFIALSPFAVLATTDGDGGVDASPRGDAPGFVQVLDDTTLLLPDRPGNNRVDSFGNIVAHPSVGLLFFVPGINETLRVNGRASLIVDAEMLSPLQAQGKMPRAGLRIALDEAFFHCGKALIRGRLWDSATQVERTSFPTLGKIMADQTRAMDEPEAEDLVQHGYRNNLY
jgi:PPOX class probable FMN-dependent enzyme